MRIKIFGTDDCVLCRQAAEALGVSAEKHEISTIYDQYSDEVATEIVSHSNGRLPVVVAESRGMLLSLSVTAFFESGDISREKG